MELLIEPQGGWTRLVLNRPQAKNALNTALLHDLAEVLGRLAADPACRAVLLLVFADALLRICSRAPELFFCDVVFMVFFFLLCIASSVRRPSRTSRAASSSCRRRPSCVNPTTNISSSRPRPTATSFAP